MQYILTEEEYKNIIPLSKHIEELKKIKSENMGLRSTVNILKSKIIEDRPCYDRGNNAYCDGCPLGFEYLNLCDAEHTNYSK